MSVPKLNQSIRALNQSIRDGVNKAINQTFEPTELSGEEQPHERSKIARETDSFAAIPIIGSLFGLARMIGSAAVAAYYKWHEKEDGQQSRIMLLRAKDEFERGLMEFIPLGGVFINYVSNRESLPLLLPEARGQYYCMHNGELYYSHSPLQNKKIQWIQRSDNPVFTMKAKGQAEIGFDYVTREYRFFVENQGRVIETEADLQTRLAISITTRDII